MTEDLAPLRFSLRDGNIDGPVVATGCVFHDGSVVMRWHGDFPSTQLYASWAEVAKVHHVGEIGRWRTAEWFDGVCFACGKSLHEIHVWFGGNGSQCSRCSAGWVGPPSRKLGVGFWVGVRLPPTNPQEQSKP
jgi:hypothetical protein